MSEKKNKRKEGVKAVDLEGIKCGNIDLDKNSRLRVGIWDFLLTNIGAKELRSIHSQLDTGGFQNKKKTVIIKHSEESHHNQKLLPEDRMAIRMKAFSVT